MPATTFKKPSGLPFGAVMTFTLFEFIALWGTWGGTILDGSMMKLYEALHSGKPYILPETNSELLPPITGIYPVDYLSKILIIFFWEIVDGSHPDAAAEGLYFFSQFVAVITVLHFDRHRAANQNIKRISPTLWIMVFQMVTFACGGPVWALCYLSSTPLMTNSSLPELRRGATVPSAVGIWLPISTILGYVVPAVVMMLKSPGVVSNQFQQKAILIWNVFPLLIMGFKTILAAVFRAGHPEQNTRAQASLAAKSHLGTARITYSLALACTLSAHAIFFGLMASSLLFPAVFAPGYADKFTPSVLYLLPFVREPGNTIGDTTRGFLSWDLKTGFSVMLLVALWQLNTVVKALGPSLRPITSVLVTLICIFVTGPGSTLLIISWLKDELLFEDVDTSNVPNAGWQQSFGLRASRGSQAKRNA